MVALSACKRAGSKLRCRISAADHGETLGDRRVHTYPVPLGVGISRCHPQRVIPGPMAPYTYAWMDGMQAWLRGWMRGWMCAWMRAHGCMGMDAHPCVWVPTANRTSPSPPPLSAIMPSCHACVHVCMPCVHACVHACVHPCVHAMCACMCACMHIIPGPVCHPLLSLEPLHLGVGVGGRVRLGSGVE